MNTRPKETGQWFVLGLLCHLALLLALFFGMRSVPESWRGQVLVTGHPGGAPWGAGGPAVREVRDHDALLLGLVALASVVVSLLVVCLSWNRRREFGMGFLVPVIWGIFYLLKP
jgi:hypothetical protein